jgi:S-adenosylmethionine decarboxylase
MNKDQSKTINFGEHLTIDGYGGERDKLDDRELIIGLLKDLPEKLEMKLISTPQIYGVPGNGKKDPGGWTGIVAIEESHISVHTFPARGFVSADVYTCRNGMDNDFILNYFKNTFGLKDIEKNFIKRGTRYPAENIC